MIGNKEVDISNDSIVYSSKEKALRIMELIQDMKAQQPVVLEVRGVSSLGDYFVICSAETGTQVRGIYDRVIAKAKQAGYTVHHCEGDNDNTWMLVDLFDVIIHIFTEESRKYYNLEHLWNDAQKIKFRQLAIKTKRIKNKHL